MSNTALIIGDPHFPFVNRRSLNGVYAHIQHRQPDIVVQIGDLYDFLSYSPFPSKRQFMLAEDEWTKGRFEAERMWSTIRRLAPSARCYQLIGNHDERPIKTLVKRAGSEYAHLLSEPLRKQFEFDGVTTQPDERSELVLKIAGQDVMFMHGFYLAPLQHLKENQMSTVFGHLHYGYTAFVPQKEKILWELNAGYIADRESFPMSYTRQRTVNKWTQGFGWIDKSGPRFIIFPWR